MLKLDRGVQAGAGREPPMQPLERFRVEFSDVEGFPLLEAEVIWDFLLNAQRNMRTRGHMMEIGVYKGRTAYLAALYLAPGEKIVLVDVNPIAHIGGRIGEQAVCIVDKSSNLAAADLSPFLGRVRWFHIDGDHSGYSVANDLALAERFLSELGVIVVDDFFNWRYPQIAAEVYRFLFARPQYKMLLCGFNKCYLVRAEDYAFYESLIRKFLPAVFAGQKVTISRSTYAHDMGSWSIAKDEGPRPVMGLDSDLSDVPF
jgi:hypothetical protein